MSLKDELAARSPRSTSGTYSKGRCGVNEWLKLQDDKLILEFKEILNTDASTMELHRFLQSKFDDLTFSLTTFRTHRNRWCTCP
jgi:lipopolysaccharide biosynthesis regulator YciM